MSLPKIKNSFSPNTATSCPKFTTSTTKTIIGTACAASAASAAGAASDGSVESAVPPPPPGYVPWYDQHDVPQSQLEMMKDISDGILDVRFFIEQLIKSAKPTSTMITIDCNSLEKISSVLIKMQKKTTQLENVHRDMLKRVRRGSDVRH